MWNNKWKGNIGEVKVISEFLKYGITISLPFGDNARYDLIADISGNLRKIQVKYIDGVNESDSYYCRCCSSTNHTNNKGQQNYIGDIDYFAFYLADIDTCCLVPIDVIGTREMFTLRNSIPKNNQLKGINFIKDYSFEKILNITPIEFSEED